jgi:hypothetical protein
MILVYSQFEKCYSWAIFFGGTWAWNQGLLLTRQVFYHLSHALPLFAIVIFQAESCVFCLWPASDYKLPTYSFHVAGLRAWTKVPGLFFEMGLTNFLPRLASNQCPPKLHFLSSWDDWHVPPCLAWAMVLNMLRRKKAWSLNLMTHPTKSESLSRKLRSELAEPWGSNVHPWLRSTYKVQGS